MAMPARRPIRLLLAAAAALALLATPLAAGAQAPPTAGPPADYEQTQGLSPVAFGPDDLLFDVVRLPMRDGVDLYLEITRPDTDVPVPVVLEASPYHGTIADRLGTRIFPDPVEDGTAVGLVGYFAPRGYAVVMLDLRGTGRSEGCLDHMGQNDRFDLKEAIEWLADQPWSNGRIGMTGHSYVGSTPMIAASTNPRGLVTIVPSAGIARAYDHQFQHGVAYQGQYLGLPVVYNVLAMDRHLPPFGNPVTGQTGDNFGEGMQYFGCGWTTTSLQEAHRQVTGEMGPFHAQRDHTAAATAWDGPVFMVQGVYDNAVRPPALDWFNQRRDPRDKLWYGQWDHGSDVHPNRRGWQWVTALHVWFDRHLAQRDVDTGPPVEVFVNGERTRSLAIRAHEQVFTDTVWPPQAARLLALYPDAATGGLAPERPAADASVVAVGSAAVQRRNVEFVSEPFDADALLAGLPVLELAASFTSQNLDLIVNVYDQGPDGSRRELSQFAMNPALRHGVGSAQPVVPLQRYHLRPPGWPVAHVLPAGHQLVMRVTTVDGDKMGINTEDRQITVFTGRLGSVLRIPVVESAVLYADPLAGRSAD
jgi:uncharacterized protein